MNDLIYRQSAINALENTECELLAEEWDELTNAIKQVPSAEQDNDMIHLQKEQEYLRGWEEGREALKQSAINAVEKESQVDGAYGYMDTKSIIDLLSDLPSAEQWTPVSEGLPDTYTAVLVSDGKEEDEKTMEEEHEQSNG